MSPSTRVSGMNVKISGVNESFNSVVVKILYLNPRVLKPHERYVERRVVEVKESILKSRCLMRPLIVDGETLTVIDGAHRLEALLRLGVSRAPLLSVNYLGEDEIRVERWIRVYRGYSRALEELLKLLRSMVPGNAVRRGDVIVYRAWGDEDPASVYQSIGGVEDHVKGVTLDFMSKMPRRLGRALILVPPRLDKRDVVKAAVEGKLFPPKTTRHVTVLKRVVLRTRLVDLL